MHHISILIVNFQLVSLGSTRTVAYKIPQLLASSPLLFDNVVSTSGSIQKPNRVEVDGRSSPWDYCTKVYATNDDELMRYLNYEMIAGIG